MIDDCCGTGSLFLGVSYTQTLSGAITPTGDAALEPHLALVPLLLYDTRNWAGGTADMLNEGSAGSYFDLTINAAGGTRVEADTSGATRATTWATLGGVPSSASFTFMFSVGDYSDPRGCLAGIVLQTSVFPLAFIQGVVDQENPAVNLAGTIDGTVQLPSAHSASGFAKTFHSDSSPHGYSTFANHFWVVNVDPTVSGGVVHIWKDGVLQDADSHVDGYSGNALTPSRTDSDIAVVNFYAYMGPRAAATPPPPGVWASSCRGMIMFRGTPTVDDLAYWQDYFAPPVAGVHYTQTLTGAIALVPPTASVRKSMTKKVIGVATPSGSSVNVLPLPTLPSGAVLAYDSRTWDGNTSGIIANLGSAGSAYDLAVQVVSGALRSSLQTNTGLDWAGALGGNPSAAPFSFFFATGGSIAASPYNGQGNFAFFPSGSGEQLYAEMIVNTSGEFATVYGEVDVDEHDEAMGSDNLSFWCIIVNPTAYSVNVYRNNVLLDTFTHANKGAALDSSLTEVDAFLYFFLGKSQSSTTAAGDWWHGMGGMAMTRTIMSSGDRIAWAAYFT